MVSLLNQWMHACTQALADWTTITSVPKWSKVHTPGPSSAATASATSTILFASGAMNPNGSSAAGVGEKRAGRSRYAVHG